MQLGFAIPTAGSWASPPTMVELSQRAEQLGYHSLWTFQRLLFPADEGATSDNPRWQPVYRSVHDPLVTLAYVAAHTERARLGIAVLNMPWFSPILLAKQASTLDHVSRGRLDLGLGLGWSEVEYAAAGASMQRRAAQSDEFLQQLLALWTQDPVDVEGEWHSVRRAHVWPRPVQQPHPPILLGGSARTALQRAGRYADGWISSSGHDLTTLRNDIDVVRDAARGAGRDPEALRFVCRGVVRVRETGSTPDGQTRRPLTGTLEEIRSDLAEIAAQGITELFVDLNFDRQVGSVDADPAASVRRAHEVLEALAPAQSG